MKNLFVLLTVALCFCAANKAMAYDFSIVPAGGGQAIYFNVTSYTQPLTVEVTYETPDSYGGSYSGGVAIPDSVVHSIDGITIDTFVVTGIGEKAFNKCYYLTNVSFPRFLKTIDSYAFFDCMNLTSLTIPNTVTVIKDHAFFGCDKVTSLTIGDMVTSIGDQAFAYCRKIPTVTIPHSVITIGEDAFSPCNALTTITIGRSVEVIKNAIEYSIFNSDESLTNIHVDPANSHFSSIDGILYNKSQDSLLRCPEGRTGNIVIPASVKHIYHEAFVGCGLTGELALPNSLVTIGISSFSGCNGLTGELILPASVKRIEDRAFSGCSGFTGELILPNLLYINQYTFSGCSGLTSVTIPNTATYIGTSAFSGCSGLASVSIPNSVTNIREFAFSGCSKLNPIDIPNSVTTIGRYAFSLCEAAASITIPHSVTSIGDGAFNAGFSYYQGSSSLTDIRVEWADAANLPTLGSKVFEYQTPPDINLHIPAGTQAMYETADVWKEFFLVEQTAATYTLTIGAFEGGVVTTDKTAYAENEAVTLTIAPATGYALTSISAHKTGEAATNVPLTGTGDTRTFNMPAYDVTVEATFGTTADFTAITDITDVPATVMTGAYLPYYRITSDPSQENLLGTPVPADATNTFIEWSVKDAGTTNIGYSETVTYEYKNGKIIQIREVSFHMNNAGTCILTATVTDGLAVGTDYTKDFSITVTSSATTDITAHPQAANYTVGETAIALSVTAIALNGGTLSYQWYTNTTDNNTGGTPITDATGSSYTPSTAIAGTTYYYVEVTNTKTGSPTTLIASQTAMVTVESIAPPAIPTYEITAALSDNGQVTASPWIATAGETVTLTITPAEGYELEAIVIHRTGTESETIAYSGEGNTRTFRMPGFAVTIKAMFKLTATTGTEASAQAKTLSAHTRNGRLYVTGLTAGQPWRIYSITGQLVVNKTAVTGEAELSLPARGVYIVQSGKKSIKIVY
jgi:hypothetical protein